MVELVANALKFTPPGSAVSIRADAAESRIAVEVRDRGSGLGPRFGQLLSPAPARASIGPGRAPHSLTNSDREYSWNHVPAVFSEVGYACRDPDPDATL